MKAKEYDYIKICLGYPNKDDADRIIWRKWNGVKTGTYDTELFGNLCCYAVDVSKMCYENQHLAPQVVGFSVNNKFIYKSVLTLNLKRKYFEQIHDGEKLNEYREIKPYWTKRLFSPTQDNQRIKQKH